MCVYRKFMVLLTLAFCVASANAADSLLEEARGLMEHGNAEAAYQLLATHEAERLGEFEFDYLLGIAAQEAGKPEVAVFALERAVSTRPESAYAHADLAQAYATLGEREAAITELDIATQLNRDPQADFLIRFRKNQLLKEDYASHGHWNAFLEFGLGHDDNVNSATSIRDLVIPAFGTFSFTLGGNSVKLGSRFNQQRGGISASYPLGEHTAVFGRITGMQRNHSRHDEFDTASLESVGGIAHQIGSHHFLLSVQNHDFLLNGQDYRYTLSGNLQWAFAPNDNSQFGLFAQVGKLIYQDADLRNTRRYVGGVFASHGFNLFSQPVLHASLYGGHEVAVADGVSYMGHHLDGVRLALENTLMHHLSSFVALGYEKRRYGGIDPLFLEQREDKQSEVSAGLVYRLPHGFSLRPTASFIKNHSNIPLNHFDRLETMLTVRKEF